MEVGTSDSCKMIMTVIEMNFVNLELKKSTTENIITSVKLEEEGLNAVTQRR